MTRCKMKCTSIIGEIEKYSAKVAFTCEYDPALVAEDQTFSKATPCGTAEFWISNPAAIAQLEVGKCYYFDIHAVPESSPVNQS